MALLKVICWAIIFITRLGLPTFRKERDISELATNLDDEMFLFKT